MAEKEKSLEKSQVHYEEVRNKYARELQDAVKEATRQAVDVHAFPLSSRYLFSSTPRIMLYRLGLRHHYPGETSPREVVVDEEYGNLFAMTRVGDRSPRALEIILGADHWVKIGKKAWEAINRLISVANAKGSAEAKPQLL